MHRGFAIKASLQGGLIYVTMALYLAAFVLYMLSYRKSGRGVFLAGFVVAMAGYTYRWFHTGHVPLQNLFEVFLTLGVFIYPVSEFSRRFLRVGASGFDMLLGAVVLVPAGFVFSDAPMNLPPALQSWLFAPHVLVYMLSYIIMAKAAFLAFEHLTVLRADTPEGQVPPEEGTYRMICFGFPLLTLGLILGSVWAQRAWGRFWGWDPKEMWSLATWLAYASYLHFRYMVGRKRPYINSIWALFGLLLIIITLLWANLARLFEGLHSYA